MRTFNTLPTNNNFFEQYATLIPTLYRLGFLAQIVSALTEVSIIYAIVYSSVRDFLPDLAHVIGAVGALIGTAFIEVGLRKFLPHSVRSILYRRFSGLELAMTIFILSSTVGLLATSAALSFKNSKTIVEAVAPPPNVREATAEGLEFSERKGEALQLFRSDSTATAARFTAEAEARRNEFQSLIQVERTRLATLREKEKSSGDRYPTQRQRVNARISEIEAKMNAELATIEQRKAAALASVQAERQNALKAAQNDFSEVRERIQTENDENRKTAAELKNAGLNELAREMELKAVDVIKMYLGPNSSAGAVEELRRACIIHLSGAGPNPFEHLHRRAIGFGRTNEELPSNGERSTVNVGADSKTRTCSNCGKGFTFKHWNARYCSDKCRIENWEKRTGGKVLKGKP